MKKVTASPAPGRGAPARPRDERGSIVLFVLFVCLSVAVVVQTLSVITICAGRTAVDESTGRQRLEEKDDALALLRTQAVARWGSMPWTVVGQPPGEAEGTVEEILGSQGWAMKATVRQEPALSRGVVSAWLERGRDGIDLPSAGLVAAAIAAAAGRMSPLLVLEGGTAVGGSGASASETGEAIARLRTLPTEPLVGPGVTIGAMTTAWKLDGGWRKFFEQNEAELADTLAGLAPGPAVTAIAGRPGETLLLPEQWGGASADEPSLLVVTGAATLDARDRGDLYGVIVVDEGDVILDGSRLHGALFATGSVDFGATGAVAFSCSILRWATDRSLVRARLVPGTRGESTG